MIEFAGLPLIEWIAVGVFHEDEATSDARQVRIPDVPGELMLLIVVFRQVFTQTDENHDR